MAIRALMMLQQTLHQQWSIGQVSMLAFQILNIAHKMVQTMVLYEVAVASAAPDPDSF
jgi:hypothetical protein